MESPLPQGEKQHLAFEHLAASLRPRLHRYCSRMTGSAIDGEDVVQDALLKALEAFPGDGSIGNPEAWLFRIAQNTALDFLRRRLRAQAIVIEQEENMIADPLDEVGQRQIAAMGLRPFMKLSPAERSSVILMDVIGYSLREICEIMEATLPAVKAALHRGRARLAVLAGLGDDDETITLTLPERERLTLYVDRFNARDFDAVRDLLAEDVKLELISRLVLNGKREVSRYFSNYAAVSNWRLTLGSIDGQPTIVSHHPDDAMRTPINVVLIDWSGDHIIRIRDFYHAANLLENADIRILPTIQASAR